jgi:hypothetical protein
MLPGNKSFLFLILIVAAICFHILTLSRYPAVFVDEAWLVSRAWAWWQTGINFGSLDAGVFDKQLDGYGTFYPIIPSLLISVFLQWFGLAVPGLRLLPLFLGLGLLVASFSIAYQLSGSTRCGLISVLLVATSHSFLISAHLIRYDIFVAALGYGAAAISLAGWRRKRSSLLFVAGLMSGLAFEVHMNAALFGPLILTILLAEGGWHLLRSRELGGLVLGGLCGLVLYAWLHVIQYPATFWAMGKGMATTHLPPVFSPGAEQLWSSARELGGYWIYLTSGRILVVVLAAITVYRSMFQNTKILLLALVVGLAAFSLLIRNKMFYYAILIAPLSDIFLAVWIQEVSRSNVKLSFWLKRTKVLGVSTLIATCVIPVYHVFSSPPSDDLKLIGNRIKQTIPTTASIMGPQIYWLELTDHPYLSWQQIRAYTRLNSDQSIEAALGALRPDILITDDDLRQYIRLTNGDVQRTNFDRYLSDRQLPKEELDSFLKRHALLLDSFVSPVRGRIEIYYIDWTASQ